MRNEKLDEDVREALEYCDQIVLFAELLRLTKAEAELAALKARIADAPVASVRVDDRMHVSIGARSNAVDFVPLHTKRVRLLVEE